MSSRSVHLLSRRGLTLWHISCVSSSTLLRVQLLTLDCSEPSMIALQCMSFLGKDASEILVAGCQSVMYKIDVDKGVVVQSV